MAIDVQQPLTPSSSQAQLFHIPDTLTRWPWPARTSPHIDKVKADFEALIKGYPQIERKALKVLEYAQTDLIVCCVYPDLNEAQLGVVTAFSMVAWLVEEAVDAVDGIEALTEIIMDALRHPFDARPAGEHIMGKMSRQWWFRVIKEMNPISVQRLFHRMEDWLLSCVHQSKISRSSRKETIEEYIETRKVNSGMPLCMTFLEMEVDIPQYVWEYPIFEEMKSLLSDIISLDNDMFSYNREQSQGDYHNILHIVMRDKQLGLQDALEWAERRHRSLQGEYFQVLAKMPSWGLEIDTQVEKYIGALGRMISGNVRYSALSKRYVDMRESKGPPDNRVFELLPPPAKTITE
ncbi:isoprenoid synthase domain-containing protein [Collybia nuda]|uniref:Terpene synthase n=1 Tax=Collybia nuda TaxID=64659 RepID=A0A9P6CKW5_9AGAR|nr:isoprenoid synthase domain-containing protein [Collybia nuda]